MNSGWVISPIQLSSTRQPTESTSSLRLIATFPRLAPSRSQIRLKRALERGGLIYWFLTTFMNLSLKVDGDCFSSFSLNGIYHKGIHWGNDNLKESLLQRSYGLGLHWWLDLCIWGLQSRLGDRTVQAIFGYSRAWPILSRLSRLPRALCALGKG